jgi:hypothetical protein
MQAVACRLLPLPGAGKAGAFARECGRDMQPLDLLRMEADIMNEPRSLPGDPLAGSTLAGYWLYGYDMPDDLGGGFVTGELLLRADGVLLRRQTLFFPTGDGRLSEGFGPWEEVTWWEGCQSAPLPRLRPAPARSRGTGHPKQREYSPRIPH